MIIERVQLGISSSLDLDSSLVNAAEMRLMHERPLLIRPRAAA